MTIVMKKLMAIMTISVLLTGCATIGLDSTAPFPTRSPVPTMTLPVPTTTAPVPTTTASVSTTTVPVPIITVPEIPPETYPWEADPSFDPNSLLSRISEDTQHSIKYAYCEDAKDITVDEVSLRFFGVFQDTYVLLVDVSSYSYPTVIVSEMVDEYAFWYSSGHTMEVFHDGSFYSLQEAFDTDLLTTDDLQTVFDNYYGAYPYLWALYYEVDE
jgi:hypothetical protein